MSRASPGHLYARLAYAARRRGSARSVYGPENTLSRRGLLTRADRRARELAGLGLQPGDPVALSLGNTAELLVLLLACSKLGAVAVPLDPARGERLVRHTAGRLPLRAVVRRPRGHEAVAPDYGDGYRFASRRRLPGSLLMLDVLHPPAPVAARWPDQPDAELVVAARGIDGTARDIVRTAEHLQAVGEAAAHALCLRAGARLVCAQPLVVPCFFDVVLLGWLASEAQLVMTEGSAVDAVLPLSSRHEDLVVVDTAHELLCLARTLTATGTTRRLQPVVPQAFVPDHIVKILGQSIQRPPRQLLRLEELGLLAHRVLERGATFEPAAGVRLRSGAAMQTGGHEVLIDTTQAAPGLPPIPATEPGSVADPPWRHCGYAGRFSRDGRLSEILGRDDGLLHIEGRRACLDHVEEVLLSHRRLTWVQALPQTDPDGEGWLAVEYRATGQTPVDDLEDHAIGQLPPFMVPRRFERQPG
ncbi:MAG: class I adenylate-forming enzyme family protein [Myxococcota bacterium]